MNREERAALLAVLKGPKGDALFRPSSASIWLNCHGSTLLPAPVQPDEKPSPYAREGTAAHTVASEALLGVRQPDEWTNRLVSLEDGMASWGVDAEMTENVQFYVDEMRSRMTPGAIMLVEQRLSLSAMDPSDPLLDENRGTSDCVIIDPVRRRLTTGDLKYGKGVKVAGDAPQLKDYALMGLLTYAAQAAEFGGWNDVETVVVQSRVAGDEPVKSVIHDPYYLAMEFAGTVVGAMEAALLPGGKLTPGSHCRWCRKAAACPALRDKAVNIARDAFAAVPMITSSTALAPLPNKIFVGTPEQPQPMTAERGMVVLPSPQSLDPGEIATILSRRAIWESWITAVEKYAVALLEGGTVVPGWVMVSRTGNRRWKSADTVASVLRSLGLQTAQFYSEPELLSPAKVEKMLKPAQRAMLSDLVERPLGAPTLVSSADKREALPPVMGAIPEAAR